MRRPFTNRVPVRILLGVLAVGMLVAVGPTGTVAYAQEGQSSLDHAKSLSRAFRNVAEASIPAVTTIRTHTKAKRIEGRSKEDNPLKGTPFEDFFRDSPDGHFRTQPFSPPREGMGSGFIIDKSGLILTNNHVVEGADEVIVHLADGREFSTTDIRTDPQTDLAIVRIEVSGSLPTVKLGDSDKMAIGDWVLAIGNPFDLESTVSAGIISGKGRQLGSIRRASFLQTDAAINPGNSGGPLVNLDGEVVGINTAIATNSGGYQGIGFAIPSNLAKWVVSNLIEKGSVERAYLGVIIRDMTPELARKFEVPHRAGVVVAEVLPETPAAEAGLEEGDLITAFAGRPVRSPRDLQAIVERTPLDSKQQIEVLRDSTRRDLQVVMARMPEMAKIAGSRQTRRDESVQDRRVVDEQLGLQLADLDGAMAQQLGYKGYSGVLVADVDREGRAFAAGIRKGMLIRKVGRPAKAVSDVDEYQAALEDESLSDGILLLVRTPGGQQDFVVVTDE